MSAGLPARLKTALYLTLRAGFRALPLAPAQRDRLRARFLDRHADLVPPPPRGRAAAGHGERRPRARADERAIGHVAPHAAPVPTPLPATLVAFYLPQFHPIPENDAWWGAGFTEWRNVTRALPQFEGHVQPRLPADLGFYDLRNPHSMRQQVALAKQYGVGAFCFYFYWFGGKTLLETPLRQWLDDPTLELPFCLCWANEQWSRRWDGRGDDVLMAQAHSAQDDLDFIAHVADYLRDPRCLRVDGRPMLLVYRPHLLPDPQATATRWRDWCREHGIGELHLAYVQGFERPDPRDIGFDAAVEFPPNMSNPRSLAADQQLLNPDYTGAVLDWRALAAEIAARPLPDYLLYPGVNPGWDNEARRPGAGRVYLHASPRGYEDWLRTTIHTRLQDRRAEQRLVFVNAWNEWAEGAVLEPDARLGHAYLDATRRALAPRPARDATPHAIVHAWYPEVLPELLAQLAASALSWRLLVTTSPDQADAVRAHLRACAFPSELMVLENRGRDILPFLHAAERLLRDGVDVALKLHTKRSTHLHNGDAWRSELLQRLAGADRAARVLQAFAQDPALGLVAPEGHLLPLAEFWGGNRAAADYLLRRTGHSDARLEQAQFISGSMFWARLDALRPLLDSGLCPSEFEAEQGQLDATLAHAVERLAAPLAERAGYRVATVAELLGQPPPAATDYAYAQRSA
ncbi:lipopolysaccharide biosynthesis protein [Xanthomonas sacchari]|uniref:glycoside hydrolase family 99-like domain-containing protein n=1 Tax=Xanthomonas sacchari TaxID=56458 RepID=UPI0027846EB4|nr:glycoside hydrolase family 99-like domain-containing protein [Xanthomonas sacchari]MDQ1094661.1 lipopolysaccharide biosynthesis protein [Xanthomonas sacchari]